MLLQYTRKLSLSKNTVMLTKPQPYEAEAVTHDADAKAATHKAEAATHEAEAEAEAATHEAEAKTHEAEAWIFDLEAEFEAKFMMRQSFEKPKNV